MKPRLKAKELYRKYHLIYTLNNYEAKQCALITIDEIINCDSFFKTLEDTKEFTKYWQEVQSEIKKL